ncbi:MAG: hypothetical protein JO118_09470 [Acetobacteraceae bacterium]|nr:hypothetical protein [Acetobacteraceae bacterium]MBV9116766.1 hypothetical protein [Acetobacteraceae bacterium]
MSQRETLLEMASRHVAEAQERVVHQELLISKLEYEGRTDLLPAARAQLEQVQDHLRHCRSHLDREWAKPPT